MAMDVERGPEQAEGHGTPVAPQEQLFPGASGGSAAARRRKRRRAKHSRAEARRRRLLQVTLISLGALLFLFVALYGLLSMPPAERHDVGAAPAGVSVAGSGAFC
jgi:hypothetical protein